MNEIPQKDKKTPKEYRKYQIFGVFLALVFPALSIFAALVLVKRDINVTTFVKEYFESGKSSILGESDEVEEQFSAFENSLEPIYTKAARLKIPSVNIDILLKDVGVDSEGTMETPKNWLEGGWYLKSGKPGEQRNVVINGHYDNNFGGPAAFYNLRNVNEGDKVEVVDDYGRIFDYKVVKLSYLDIENPSRLEVLEDEDEKSTLTLITCGGVWFPNSGYNKRLVVKAELVKEEVIAEVAET